MYKLSIIRYSLTHIFKLFILISNCLYKIIQYHDFPDNGWTPHPYYVLIKKYCNVLHCTQKDFFLYRIALIKLWVLKLFLD